MAMEQSPIITCSQCNTQHEDQYACHECARRKLMAGHPLPDNVEQAKERALATHLINTNNREANQSFLNRWAKRHGEPAREQLMQHMRDIWEERTAEKRRLETVL